MSITTPIPAAVAFDPKRIREDFAYLDVAHPCGLPIAYLDNGASTQHPRQVLDAMRDCYEHAYANVHRGIHHLSEAATDRFEHARQQVARFINAATDTQVIFTAGSTAGINAVAQGWGRKFIGQGDRVITTQMEHHANIVPWYQLRSAVGCEVQFVSVSDDGLLDAASLEEALAAKPKLLAITALSNVLGTVNPIREIIAQAHDAGAVVLVDAAQAAPHLRIDVQELDCDFLVFSSHKMLGPTGVGVLYAKAEHLEAMDPFIGGGGMIEYVTEEGFTPAQPPAKFEGGTPPIVEAVGLAAAIDYLQRIGLVEIANHEHTLVTAAYERLREIEGVRILGPGLEDRASIVSFVIEGVHAHDVAQVLDRHGVAVRPGHHCTMPLHSRFGIAASSRASFYLYNTADEVDRLIDGVVDAKEKLTHRNRRRLG